MSTRMTLKQWSNQNDELKKLFDMQWTGLTESGEAVNPDDVSFRSRKKLQWKTDEGIKVYDVKSKTLLLEKQAATLKKYGKTGRGAGSGKKPMSVTEYCELHPYIGKIVSKQWVGKDVNENTISMRDLAFSSKTKVLWKTEDGSIKAYTVSYMAQRLRKKYRTEECEAANKIIDIISDDTEKINTFPLYIDNTNYFVVASLRKNKYSPIFAYIIYCEDSATNSSSGEYIIVTKITYNKLKDEKIVHKIGNIDTICVDNDAVYNKLITSGYIGKIAKDAELEHRLTFETIDELLSKYKVVYNVIENDPDRTYSLNKIYYRYINGVKKPIAYGLINELGKGITLSRRSVFTIISRQQVVNADIVGSNINIDNRESVVNLYLNKLNMDGTGIVRISTFSAEKDLSTVYTRDDIKRISGKNNSTIIKYKNKITKRKSDNIDKYNIMSTFTNILSNSTAYTVDEVNFVKTVMSKCKQNVTNMFDLHNIVKNVERSVDYTISALEVDKYGVLSRANIVDINTNKILTVDIADIFSNKYRCKLTYNVSNRLSSHFEELLHKQDLKLSGIVKDVSGEVVITVGPYTDPILLNRCVDKITVYKNKNAVSSLVSEKEKNLNNIDKVLNIIKRLGNASSEVPLFHYSSGRSDKYKILFEITTRYLARSGKDASFYIAKNPHGDFVIIGNRTSDSFKSLNGAWLLNWDKSEKVVMPWEVLSISNSSNTTVAITKFNTTNEYNFIKCYDAFDKDMPIYSEPVDVAIDIKNKQPKTTKAETNKDVEDTKEMKNAKAEPVKAETAKAEPVKTEPVKTESVKAETKTTKTETNKDVEDTKEMKNAAYTAVDKINEVNVETVKSLDMNRVEYIRLYRFISKANANKVSEFISGAFKDNLLTAEEISNLFKTLIVNGSNEEILGKMMAYTLEQKGELSSLMNVINMLS